LAEEGLRIDPATERGKATMLERYWIAYGAAYMLVTYGICVGIAVSMCDGHPRTFNYQLALYILVRLSPLSSIPMFLVLSSLTLPTHLIFIHTYAPLTNGHIA
jgi:hypothetical protein